eukprot:1403148-Rhodomonas_salina.2
MSLPSHATSTWLRPDKSGTTLIHAASRSRSRSGSEARSRPRRSGSKLRKRRRLWVSTAVCMKARAP